MFADRRSLGAFVFLAALGGTALATPPGQAPVDPSNLAANVQEQRVTDALNGTVQNNLDRQAAITAGQQA